MVTLLDRPEAAKYSQFISGLDPQFEMAVRCSEDRPLVPLHHDVRASVVTPRHLGPQLVGAQYAIAFAYLVAQEAEHPGYANMMAKVAPHIGKLAAITGQQFRERSIDVRVDEACGGNLHGATIAANALHNTERTTFLVEQLLPRNIGGAALSSALNKTFGAVSRVLNSGLIVPNTDEDHGRLILPRNNAGRNSSPVGHKSDVFVIMRGEHESFDTHHAWEKQRPGYGINSGDFRNLGDPLFMLYGEADADLFEVAGAVWHAGAVPTLVPQGAKLLQADVARAA